MGAFQAVVNLFHGIAKRYQRNSKSNFVILNLVQVKPSITIGLGTFSVDKYV